MLSVARRVTRNVVAAGDCLHLAPILPIEIALREFKEILCVTNHDLEIECVDWRTQKLLYVEVTHAMAPIGRSVRS
jgi:hypothetical protein